MGIPIRVSSKPIVKPPQLCPIINNPFFHGSYEKYYLERLYRERERQQNF
jgi:hypothetical protein